MNEAQARATGHDCIYDPVVDEWFTQADFVARIKSAQAILPEAKNAELTKAVPVSSQTAEPARRVEPAKSATKINDAPTASKKGEK